LREPTLAPEPLPATEESVAADVPASSTCTPVIKLPWTAQAFPSIKGWGTTFLAPRVICPCRAPVHGGQCQLDFCEVV
jgi:hypothetical protein